MILIDITGTLGCLLSSRYNVANFMIYRLIAGMAVGSNTSVVP